MTEKSAYRGRSLYLNPARSPLEAELDALLTKTYRSQALMRGYLLAGYALAKEGITWDPLTHRLVRGNDPVQWSVEAGGGAAQRQGYAWPVAHSPASEPIPAEVKNTPEPVALPEGQSRSRSLKDKYAALTRGA